MDGQVDGIAQAVDCHTGRIDQERHIVIDDFHDRMRRGPAIGFPGRIVNPHLRFAGRAIDGKVEMTECRAGKIRRAAAAQIVYRDIAVIPIDEFSNIDVLAR